MPLAMNQALPEATMLVTLMTKKTRQDGVTYKRYYLYVSVDSSGWLYLIREHEGQLKADYLRSSNFVIAAHIHGFIGFSVHRDPKHKIQVMNLAKKISEDLTMGIKTIEYVHSKDDLKNIR